MSTQARKRKPRRPRKPRKLPRSARQAQALKPNSGIELYYALQLRRLVREWAELARKRLLPLARRVAGESVVTDSKEDVRALSAAARRITRRMRKALDKVAERTDGHTGRELRRLGIRITDSEPWLKPLIAKWRTENISLISNLLEEEAERLNKILTEGSGRHYESLARDIQERLQVTEGKAQLWARDQTLKLNSQIASARAEAAGIEEFEWVSSKDSRVRDLHESLDGNIYRIDDPPESGVNGEKQMPGVPINCRCTARYLIPDID